MYTQEKETDKKKKKRQPPCGYACVSGHASAMCMFGVQGAMRVVIHGKRASSASNCAYSTRMARAEKQKDKKTRQTRHDEDVTRKTR